jgi:hypothetical protein
MRIIAIIAAVASLSACAPSRPRPNAVPQSANPSSIVAMEIAFSREAGEKGENATFRRYAAKDALVFRPQPVMFSEFSKGVTDSGPATKWQPHKIYMSCDGRTAVVTGAWQVNGANGYFTTVWLWHPKDRSDAVAKEQGTGGEGEWKWIMRHGDALTAPRPTPEIIETKIASCKGRANAPINAPDEGVQMKTMFARDQSLNWEWQYRPDKSRTVTVRLWNGVDFDDVLTDRVAKPAAN